MAKLSMIKRNDKRVNLAKKYLPKVYKALDKAAESGVIKANKSSRLKSHSARSLAK